MQALAVAIGHRFERAELLEAALTHPSFRNERKSVLHDNQRLEFLGDAALDLVVSETLYAALPHAAEGVLTMLRARIVCEPTLANAARMQSIGAVLQMGRGELNSGGHERDSLLADALEAIIGAVFLDGGYSAAKRVVRHLLAAELAEAIGQGGAGDSSADPILQLQGNWKTVLQQRLQRRGSPLPSYRVHAVVGPDHAHSYVIDVEINVGDGILRARGEGLSKKAAESAAACSVLAAWDAAETINVEG